MANGRGQSGWRNGSLEPAASLDLWCVDSVFAYFMPRMMWSERTLFFPQDSIVEKVEEPQKLLHSMYRLEHVEWSEHESASITRPVCSCSTETLMCELFLNKHAYLHLCKYRINLQIFPFWENQSSSPLMDSVKIWTIQSVSFSSQKKFFLLCVKANKFSPFWKINLICPHDIEILLVVHTWWLFRIICCPPFFWRDFLDRHLPLKFH